MSIILYLIAGYFAIGTPIGIWAVYVCRSAFMGDDWTWRSLVESFALCCIMWPFALAGMIGETYEG